MRTKEYTKMFNLEDTHFWFVGKRYFIDSLLTPYRKNIKRVLDLGSGTGGTTNYLHKYGEVVGMEMNKYAVKLAKSRGINVCEGNINSFNFPKNTFDLVTILDVLYHKDVWDEVSILKKVKSVLKDNGFLLITDSAFNFLKSYHDKATQGKRRYRVRELKKMVGKSGFKVLIVSYTYFSIFPFVVIKRFISSITKGKSGSDVEVVSGLLNNILIFLLKLESKLLKHLSFPFGSSIILLAQKQN